MSVCFAHGGILKSSGKVYNCSKSSAFVDRDSNVKDGSPRILERVCNYYL